MQRLQMLVSASLWALTGVLSTAQAAGVSGGSSNYQQPNLWAGAAAYYGGPPNAPAYAPPPYGYAGSYPQARRHDNTSSPAPWNAMQPHRMMNMMPNPMRMFGNPNQPNADYPPLPPQGAYPYAHPGLYPPAAYSYQGAAPLGQQGYGAAPTEAQQPHDAPPAQPPSYAAPSRSGGGMGMGNQRQQPNYSYQHNPAYQQAYPHQQGGGYYPQQMPSAAQHQWALVDRGGFQTPPSVMQSPAMSSEKPLVDRGNFPEPPPIPEMPPMRQGVFNTATPPVNFPQSAQTRQQAPASNAPRYAARNDAEPISPQAGSAYSVPPVAPGLDMYPGISARDR